MKTYRIAVLRCDEPHVDGLIYPEEILRHAVEAKRPLMEEHKFFGPIAEGESFIRLREVSFVVRDMGGTFSVDIEPVPTPPGTALESYLFWEATVEGGRARLIIVGEGTTANGRIQDDYKLVGFKFPREVQDHLDTRQQDLRAASRW